ncbi:universal stress protein [Saccharopolyspora sp. HNM0983]|uniref:Universal stress protein n=1 Tax=Saccharopolyspora montiporae TaxID=2781240 RepID=A0A929G0T9_9PSEU|nr:universal stress protein [Saccharopolyspora sp. HNM0983]MBE9375965.1 universal stress protein [Saccharopolyspora sp. HNM0983]
MAAGGRPIVVGWDLSDSSRRAVWWAAREASSRGVDLLLVHVFTWPFEEFTPIRVAGADDTTEPVQQALRRALDDLVESCHQIDPELDVRTELRNGDPAHELGALSEEAELLVLGGPSGDEVPGIGSTSAELVSRRASTAVVVVRGDPQRTTGPVVVGVDGSPVSAAAVAFAFDYAARHDRELVAVHAWSDLPLEPFAQTGTWDTAWGEVREEAEQVVAAALAGYREQYPDVVVRREVAPEKPAAALFREAADGGLLVVGSHGRGRIRRALLGSVSHAAVNRAPAPVAVVRAGTG